MNAVNNKFSRWKNSVRYLFESSIFNRDQEKSWGLEDFRREANACIEARFGEVDARKRAAQFGTFYIEQDSEGRKEVLNMPGVRRGRR